MSPLRSLGLLCLTALVAVPARAEASPNRARGGLVHVAEVQLEKDKISLDTLARRYDVSAVRGNVVEIYAKPSELAELREAGLRVKVVRSLEPRFRSPDETTRAPSAWNWDVFHGYDDVSAFLTWCETTYPALCKKVSLGKSQQGRELWAVRISDNVGQDEDEPEVRLVGGLHGDEIVGIELTLRTIDHLLTNYASDSRSRTLVDGAELWFVPMVNPDGNSAVPRSRYNANGIDLNRAWPDGSRQCLGNLLYGPAPTLPLSTQPEIRHLIDWSVAQRFVVGGFFHGGAVTAVYPYSADESWSTKNLPTPDDALFKDIATVYASANTEMAGATDPGPIVNAGDWYMVRGSSMDWTYNYTGLLDFDLEVSGSKEPAASTLASYWSNNQEAILAFMETAFWGVRGTITDAKSGAPVSAAVLVEGHHHFVFTDADVGDYHRPLRPGTYTLTFSAPGYLPQTVSGVVVSAGQSTRLDVRLEPARAAFAAKINFGASSASPPTGHFADIGGLYGVRDGLSYGWGASMTAAAVQRNFMVSQDPRYDSFVEMGAQVWEVQVPVGTYEVRAVSGDPLVASGTHGIDAEGVQLLAGQASDARRFVDGSATVYVSDGRLTLASRGGAANKLVLVEVSAGPALELSPASLEVNEGQSGSLQVRLTEAPVADVVVSVSITGDVDLTTQTPSLTFTKSSWSTLQTVTVAAAQDADAVNGTSTLRLSAPGFGAVEATVREADDERPGLTITPLSGLVTGEGGRNASFTVVLNTRPSAAVTVSLQSTDSSEGIAVPDALTFTTTDWSTPQQVNVLGVEDALVDGDVPYAIRVTISAGDADYLAIDPPDVSVIGQDNDGTAVNRDPVARDDEEYGQEDEALTIDLVANDTDADSDPLEVTEVSQPAHGAVVDQHDGTVTYTPHANYSGSDEFTYSISDGNGGSASATVTVQIDPVQDVPVAADDAFEVAQDGRLDVAVPGPLKNDTDVDGDALTAIPGTKPTRGTLTLNQNGSFTYVPEKGFSGSDSFQYVASDGGRSSQRATVSITVKAASPQTGNGSGEQGASIYGCGTTTGTALPWVGLLLALGLGRRSRRHGSAPARDPGTARPD